MYYLLINGQKTGTYSAQEVQQMLRQNAIGYETQFWKDGMFSWETIGAHKHLFETSNPPTQQQSSYQQSSYQQYQQPQSPQYYQQSPMMVQPAYNTANKSRLTYILLGVFLGGLGIHNFYAGYTGKAVAQLLLMLFLFWTVVVPLGITIWVIVELCTVDTDANGMRMI